MRKQKCRRIAQETGITLIALVVTIIVLLILAGITITVVFGEYGIINMAKRAAEATNQAMQNEQEDLSNVAGWMQNYLNGSNQGGNESENPEINEEVNKVYSVPDLLDRIAPADLFEYEIIENGNFELVEYETLPKKTARITKIKEEFCNAYRGENTWDTAPEGYENLNYDIIYKGNQISEELVIPYKATIGEEEYTITEVSIGVRRNLPNIRSVIYPDTVIKIYNDAMEWIPDDETGYNKNDHAIYIEQIVLPKNLQEVGKGSFIRNKFTNMTLPSSVISIGENAFGGCNLLENIILPEGIQEIGSCAFDHCTSLKKITIPSSIQSIGLAAFSNCTELTRVELPSNLKSIGNSTFAGCSGLTSIELPPNLESIGVNTFAYTGLISIEIPTSVKSIDEMAFRGCFELTSIELPLNLQSIGNNAFEDCDGLTSIGLLPNLQSIGNNAFEDCDGLTSIELPPNLKSIGNEAFYRCRKLKRVVIPSSVTTIGTDVFRNTYALQILLRRTREFYSRFTMGSIRSNSNLELYR